MMAMEMAEVFSDSSATVQVQNSIIAGNFDTPGNAGGGLKILTARERFHHRDTI